ncbi:MAG: ferrous iron transport protein A [Clostridiales bacterium]|nr:ferrous iron transport protein A [Clostridiales bacterium]MDY4144554.1 FeoA family protein [Oscillospiraceae bacterium]
MTLDKLPIGKPAIILTVGGEGDLRCHLLDMGLIPHTEVTVRKVAPLGDPMELHLRGYTMTLRKEDAARIEVRPKEEI